MSGENQLNIKYRYASQDDIEELVQLRISAMEESLRALGRFDPQRARERLTNSFLPQNTFLAETTNKIIGFYMITEESGCYQLQGFKKTNELEFDNVYSWSQKPL